MSGTPINGFDPNNSGTIRKYNYQSLDNLPGYFAGEYSSSATYSVGDYVLHEHNLYKCTTAISTAEAWTAAHWTAAVFGDEVSSIKGDLDENDNLLGKTTSYNTTELYDANNNVYSAYAYGNVGDNIDFASAGQTSFYQMVSINGNDEFTLDGRVFADAYRYLVIYTDANGVILKKDRPTVEVASSVTNFYTTAPFNASRLYFSSTTAASNSIKKITSKTVALAIPGSSLSTDVSNRLQYSVISGQHWAVFGDSWTVQDNVTKKWCEYVAEELRLTLYDFAVSGSGYRQGSAYFGKRINDKLGTGFTGVVTIFGSGNDCQYMSQYAGTSDDLYDPTQDTGDTVGGRINYAFSVIKTKAPLCKTVVISPCPWEIYPVTTTNNAMAQYVELLKECTEKAGFIFVDMYHNSGLRPDDDTQADLWVEQSPTNRVHLNGRGHYFLYPQMFSIIKKYVPNIVAPE